MFKNLFGKKGGKPEAKPAHARYQGMQTYVINKSF